MPAPPLPLGGQRLSPPGRKRDASTGPEVSGLAGVRHHPDRTSDPRTSEMSTQTRHPGPKARRRGASPRCSAQSGHGVLPVPHGPQRGGAHGDLPGGRQETHGAPARLRRPRCPGKTRQASAFSSATETPQRRNLLGQRHGYLHGRFPKGPTLRGPQAHPPPPTKSGGGGSAALGRRPGSRGQDLRTRRAGREEGRPQSVCSFLPLKRRALGSGQGPPWARVPSEAASRLRGAALPGRSEQRCWSVRCPAGAERR